ncbi:hypothetical protein [uncultured Anaerovibrio sp.]|nr:hypothetical protein [uncultured Anaerovibrio sp.]
MIKLVGGYVKTMAQYWATKKGRHDILDYGRGIAIIVIVCIVAIYLVSLF